ncbi:serine hydrolase [Ferrovibrio terrae]|uniref:serine hydrolase domain-containing protein n=1 Tax=Ferrovibrio terrae TaxID=2594003 RepID=UPI00313820B1
MFRLIVSVWLLLLPLAAQAQDCAPPPDLKDGWRIASPQSQGMDAALLCAIGARFEAWKEANAHSVLVLRNGQLVYERYFTGEDYRWGNPLGSVTHDATKPHDLRSISKSVVSLLVGIAVDRGWISLDQSVFAFFPEHADLRTPAKDAITIRHLLTMSAGLEWNEDLPYSNPRNSETAMNNAPDAARYVLGLPLMSTPGQVYNYSGGSAEVLAAILQKVSGRRIDVLSRDELFAPLGIAGSEWVSWRERPVVASGLRLRPRDLARIGQLVLDKGRWQGQQIVSENWIAESIAPQINGQGVFFYGYQWWLGRSLVEKRETVWAAGYGHGGQRLYILPEQNIVIVVHAGLYASPLQGAVGHIILNRHVLPAVSIR